MLNSALDISDPQRIREGLPIEVFEELRHVLNLPFRKAASLVQISPRTLRRRRKEGRLRHDESDRVARVAWLAKITLETFGEDEAAARAWLTAPHTLLGGEAPLDHADTYPGARAVLDLLTAFRHGFLA